MNFWAVLHDNFNESTFQLSVFSTPSNYSSNAGSICHPCSWIPDVQAECLCLWAPKAPCLTGVNHNRKALEEVCWGGRTAAVDKRPLVGLETRSCGKPRNKKAQQQRSQLLSTGHGLKKETGVPLFFPPNPTAGKEWTSSLKTSFPSKFHFLSHPQVRMSH